MSPLTPDPYKILGVPKDAQIGEIRSAHRKLVLKCHPDKVQDPELKALKQDEFQQVQQAYEILSDEKERSRYDDTVQLAELRRQMQQKANISVSRTSPKYQEFEIRTAEPPSSSYKSNGSAHMPPNMPNVKVFTTTYPRSWEDDNNKRPTASSRYYDGTETARSSRREATYSDRPSKREAEKERERERERKEDKERERRKREKKEREEEVRRQEKEDKKKEKKAREKQRSKEMKRETESRHSPYIETWEEDTYVPKPEKKKSSSSKKHDEKRERSSHREDIPPPSNARYGSEEPSSFKMDSARAYIQQSKGSGPERTKAYHGHGMPAVPTPPPPADTPRFTPPEEPIMRSSARPRPSSSEMPSSRDKSSYQRPSRERLDGRDRDEPIIVAASPGRHAGFPPKMAHDLSSSPPHISQVHRTNTMPASTPSAARPIPMVSRSNTFSGTYDTPESAANRGRNRNRHHAQVREEDEFDDGYDRHDYDRRPAEKERERERERDRDRDRKHRSSKKHRSPERGTETRYHVDNGRAKLYHSSSSYSRKLPEQEPFYYEPGTSRTADAHAAYSGSGYKVKTSKSYNVGDVSYSSYPAQSSGYRGEYQPVYAA